MRISIHALHEESDLSVGEVGAGGDISIHALHEESDQLVLRRRRDLGISIHALHEESDTSWTSSSTRSSRFQSTLSMRRATVI